MTENYLYIFVHIPKCAGTTFNNHIRRNFSKSEVVRLDPKILGLKGDRYSDGDYKRSVEQYFSKFSKGKKSRIRIIHGHIIPFGIHKLFERKVRYFTFLRKPERRTISQYNQIRAMYHQDKNKNISLYEKSLLVNGKLPSFDKWLINKYDYLVNYRNIGIKMTSLLQSLGFLEKGKLNDKTLRECFNKFYFLGITERFGQDSLYLYDLLGINKFFFNKNISRNYVSAKNLKESNSLLAEKSKDDNILFKYAVKENRKFRKTHKDYDFVVSRMDTKRKLFLPFTQTIYGFDDIFHSTSAYLRTKSGLYSKALDYSKVKGWF